MSELGLMVVVRSQIDVDGCLTPCFVKEMIRFGDVYILEFCKRRLFLLGFIVDE